MNPKRYDMFGNINQCQNSKDKALKVYYQACYAEVCAAGSVGPQAGDCSTRQKLAPMSKVVATKAGHYGTMRLG